MKDTIANLPLSLEAPVIENGENFSVRMYQALLPGRSEKGN